MPRMIIEYLPKYEIIGIFFNVYESNHITPIPLKDAMYIRIKLSENLENI